MPLQGLRQIASSKLLICHPMTRYSNLNKLECAPLCDVDMIVVDIKSVGVVITRSEKGDSDRGWYFQCLGRWQSRQPYASKSRWI
jgi:hypothetical protein